MKRASGNFTMNVAKVFRKKTMKDAAVSKPKTA